MNEDERRKQTLERLEWQLEFEEMRMRSMARDEITVAFREMVDRFIENLETIWEQEASRSFWERVKYKFFGRQFIQVAKATMKETAETVNVGDGKGLNS